MKGRNEEFFTKTFHEVFMKKALKLARNAFRQKEVPVGALVCRVKKKALKNNLTLKNEVEKTYALEIVAEAHNQCETLQSPSLHAELLALQKASKKLRSLQLKDCFLYVTLEPCFMCAGAIILSRIQRVVFGAFDPKSGALGSIYNVLKNPKINHKPEVVSGVLSYECSKIMKDFFKMRRNENKEKKNKNKAGSLIL